MAGERIDLGSTELQRNGGLRVHDVEAVIRALDDLECHRHTGCLEAVGILDVFVVEQICGADTDGGGVLCGDPVRTRAR